MVDVSPFGLKTDPANPVEGSANQWEGDGLGGLPVEVYSDVDGALKELQERPNEYSSVSVVVYGSPSFLQETVTQAVGMGVVVSGRAWVLVSKVAEWHQSVFPSTLLTYQHNLVLVTPLLRTPRTPAPGEWVIFKFYAESNLTNLADWQGAQGQILKIYLSSKDFLGDLSDFELLDITDYTCRSVICGRLGGRGGESLESHTGRTLHRLTFLNGGLAWVGVGCGRAGGHVSLTADPFSLPAHLGNITIPVAVVKGSPTLSLVRNSDGGHYLDGFLGEILRLLQQDLDFRVVVSQIPGFGNRLANGTWIGIVGAVARKEVEVGLASLSISHIRYQVVEFSEHLISTGVFLMYPARQLTQPVSTVFLVFSPELWGCLLGQITLLGTVLYLACYRDAAEGNHSPLYYLFASFRTFVYQGTLEPQTTATRLTYLSSLIFALVVYALYSGNLTAVLSLPRLQEYPKSAEEMLEQGYAPLLTKGFHQYDYFKFSPLDALRTLFRHAEEKGTIYPFGRIDHKTALQRFSKGRVASVITPLGIVFRQNSGADRQQPCPFYVESAPLKLGFISIILQKNSFFSEIINARLRWLRDSGNLREIYGRYNVIQCVPSGSASGTSRPLSLTVLLGAFIMWLCGVLVSCAIFLLEFLASRGRKS
ncbi:glutamate receptor ionotropic, delta-2-like [Portunus trituberculatus]|uniref:glutamate receptor ionotropic, delta-2-like n=1 Tax=Portunus trituberculatus TaxID=210409 RepID=UPI001E1CC789|nr:glutamate receptor ionotropic, delta-2-like [Portunus trituberculatus]